MHKAATPDPVPDPVEIPTNASSAATAQTETAPSRRGEELNTATLAVYLRGKIDGVGHGIEVRQFSHGHSNLTYLVQTGEREYVLRRGPLGPVASKAHNMAREFNVLQAVHSHFPEAPRVYHLCEDAAVLGAVFFLMERRQGLILRDHLPSTLAATPDAPRCISEAFIDGMVRLHAVEVFATGLVSLGKPEGFLERQVQGWADRWSHAQTGAAPEMEAVIKWLADRLPKSQPPTLVHNDYKLDNVMLRFDRPGEIEAVLDWEMTTVGDPLADLGLTLCYWAWANAGNLQQDSPPLTSQSGWYTREQLVRRYAERTGRDVSNIRYYEVLGIFKLAVILQQIYYRYHRGQTSDERFRNFDQRVRGLIALATSLISANASTGISVNASAIPENRL